MCLYLNLISSFKYLLLLTKKKKKRPCLHHGTQKVALLISKSKLISH